MEISLGEIVGCFGEGDSVYIIESIDSHSTIVYLRAFGNTSVDGGWKNTSQVRKIQKISKKKVPFYDVVFSSIQMENHE